MAGTIRNWENSNSFTEGLTSFKIVNKINYQLEIDDNNHARAVWKVQNEFPLEKFPEKVSQMQ